MTNKEKIEGYYVVKFYNHKKTMILLWNGKQFEKFQGDATINDEIESYKELDSLIQEREREAVGGFASFLSASPWLEKGYLRYLKVDVDIYLKQKEVENDKR